MVVVPAVWLAPALLPGRVLSSADMLLGSFLLNASKPADFQPSNQLIGDTVMQMMPWRKVASTELRSGRVPFWNPHAFAGSPLLGNAQSGVFDPLSLPYLLTDEPVRATAWVMLLRLWVAGFGTWLLAVKLGASRRAAVVAASVYQVGGFTLVWLMYPLVASSVWVPWALLAAEHVVDRATPRRVAGLALALAAVTYGGQVEVAFLAAVAVAVWLGLRRAQLRGLSWRTAGASVAALAAAGLLTAALTAPVTVPFLDALSQGTLAGARATSWGHRPPRLDWFVLGLFPFLFGRPTAGDINLAGLYTNFCEHSGAYASVLGLGLAIVGIASARRRSPWAAVAVLGGAAWAYAASIPPLSLLARVVPGLAVLPPARAVFIALLAAALLAARGVDAAIADLAPRTRRAVAASLAALAGVAAAHGIWLLAGAPGHAALLRLARRSATFRLWFTGAERTLAEALTTGAHQLAVDFVLPWALVAAASAAALLAARRLRGRLTAVAIAIVLSDLALFGWGFNPAIPEAQAYPRTERLRQLGELAEGGRVLVLDWGLYANVASYYGLDDINGYDAIGRRRLTELLRLACPFPPGPMHWPIAAFDCHASPVIDILGVTAVASARPRAAAGLIEAPPARSGGHLYRNTGAMPRAFVPTAVVRADDLDAALRIARTSPPDPRATALVEASSGELPEAGSGHVTYRRPAAARIDLDATMASAGLVVVSESWDPGWRATVDGAATPVYPCDIALMAVPVPAGAHRVELAFRPRGWTAAVTIWLIGLAALAVSLPRRRG